MTPQQIADLRRRAETGEARAQYALASALYGAGQRDEADLWLKRAAEAGDPEAHFTLATRLLQKKAGLSEARALLEQSVSGGSTAGMRTLSVLLADGFGVPSDWRSALKLALRAAISGDAPAACDLGGLLILKDIDDIDGGALIESAATSDPVAGATFVRRAIEGRGNPRTAQDVLAHLVNIKYPRAEQLKRRLSQTAAGVRDKEFPNAKATPSLDWTRIESKLATIEPALGGLARRAGALRPSERAVVHEPISAAPHAYAVRDAVPPEMLEYLMAAAARCLGPSMTFDPLTGAPRKDEYRTSMTATLGPADQDLSIVAINQLLARFAGIEHSRGEFISVLRYAPGEEYRPHFDWIPPTGRDFAACGQRIMTALLYLNDEYEGGETHFMAPDVKFKGAPGDVLIFSNVTADGAPDSAARHAGLPVRAGVKWIASKWFREREFAF